VTLVASVAHAFIAVAPLVGRKKNPP